MQGAILTKPNFHPQFSAVLATGAILGQAPRVGHFLRSLNLRHQFKKEKIGTLYPVTMPLVQITEENRLRAIQPLHFERTEPEKIIEHGNLWIGKLSTLQELNELPEDILIPVEKPVVHKGDVQKAWTMVQNRLKDFGDIADASNETAIEKFAKGTSRNHYA
ncbi:hypothetical protein [Endozoicomonas sp. ALB032]|uniref:hypothetical protein n=1 Tax=Endozoicomonas sp. ALB032 TaxID=3403082 RepID=UPI003BB766EB